MADDPVVQARRVVASGRMWHGLVDGPVRGLIVRLLVVVDRQDAEIRRLRKERG